MPSWLSGSRDLSFYLGARLCGTIGIQVQSVAIGWQVYARTGDAMDLGWVGLSQFLPLALLSLHAGNVADRSDRRRIVVLTRLVYALGSLALAGLSVVPESGVAPVYAVLMLLGATRAFLSPAHVALLPWLVPGDRLSRAIAMSSTTFQIATIGGPALGGLIYAFGGATTAYLVAAACELAAAGLVFAIQVQIPQREPPRESAVERVLEGVRFVWNEKVLLGAISLDLFAVLLGGAVALMPIFARDILQVGATGLGLLRGAPAVGAAVVALTLAVRPLSRRAGPWMLVSVALFGIATIVFGLSQHFAASVVALAVLGAADMVSVVVRQSLVQLRTPDEMRGRVASVNMVFIGASNELGEFESGITAALLGRGAIGAVRAAILGGVGTLIVTGLWTLAFPQLRRVDRLQPSDPS